jgi:HD superfamily phosphodiesterase
MNIRKLKSFIINKLEAELSEDLSYHCIEHTLHVLKACNQYIKRMNINPKDAYLLRTSGIMHDTGYLWSFDNHERESIKYAKKILPEWNYSPTEIEKIAGMIKATQVPQKPTNVLEQIMSDSDLDYLGTKKFYEIGNSLYKELKAHNKISTPEEWDKLQVDFLKKHHFHTPFGKKFREPVKQQYIREIMDKWGW